MSGKHAPPVALGDIFVGRDEELGRLEDGLERTIDGAGRTVLLAGEAGIGKTRTAEVFAAQAAAPEDIPASIPSSTANLRAIIPASSLVT